MILLQHRVSRVPPCRKSSYHQDLATVHYVRVSPAKSRRVTLASEAKWRTSSGAGWTRGRERDEKPAWAGSGKGVATLTPRGRHGNQVFLTVPGLTSAPRSSPGSELVCGSIWTSKEARTHEPLLNLGCLGANQPVRRRKVMKAPLIPLAPRSRHRLLQRIESNRRKEGGSHPIDPSEFSTKTVSDGSRICARSPSIRVVEDGMLWFSNSKKRLLNKRNSPLGLDPQFRGSSPPNGEFWPPSPADEPLSAASVEGPVSFRSKSVFSCGALTCRTRGMLTTGGTARNRGSDPSP